MLELGADSEAALSHLVSGPSEERINPQLENDCGVPLELLWVDFEGRERSYGWVPADASRTVQTYAGHVWRLRTRDGVAVRGFVAGDEDVVTACDEQAFREAAPLRAADVERADTRANGEPSVETSPRTMEPAGIVVQNACDADVVLWWVDFEGRERSYGRVAGGDAREQQTFVGHQWRLRTEDGTEVLRIIASEARSVFAACGGETARRRDAS